MSTVTLHQDAAGHPLATMVARLVGENLKRDSSKIAALTRLDFTAVLVATDLDETVTLEFKGPAGLVVHSGHAGDETTGPTVCIHAETEAILDLARLTLIGRTGVPVLWNPTGAAVVRRFFSGTLTIRPLVRNIGRLLRLLTVISVM